MDPQTAEAGEAYLNSMGFRSLIEWVTAEALLSRPEDPLTFIKTIIDEKLSERPPGEKYHGDHALAYIKQCYAAASASADENGLITVRPRRIVAPAPAPHKAPPVSGGDTSDPALVKRLVTLEKLLASARLINMQLNPDEATKIIVKEACILLNAERATVFTYDKASNMLVLKVSEGAADDIRVPFGKGIAGTVAATGKAMSISDAYADPNFDAQYDKQTGYKTTSILCAPVRNGTDNIVGVVQVLNKLATDKDQCFTETDEEIIGILAALAGVAMYNARTHHMAVLARERVSEVLAIVRDMHADLGFSPLMFTISTRVQRLVNSDRCTLYIVDRAKSELWTLQGEVNIRVPISQGIAGAVVQSNAPINLDDAYEDPRFNKDIDQKHGYRTRSVLAMPLRDHNNEPIAVVQLINKNDDLGVFSRDDEELLGTFLQIAGPILASSQSFVSKTTAAAEGPTEFPGKVARTQPAEKIEMNVICENDEEEA